MAKYRKKPVVVEATQWFKNGDHPEDNAQVIKGCYEIEGEVVRYFRRPDISGTQRCPHCDTTMHFHGWIDRGVEGYRVCPGDWIVTEDGEYTPYKPNMFHKLFEEDLTDQMKEAAKNFVQAVREGPGFLPYGDGEPLLGLPSSREVADVFLLGAKTGRTQCKEENHAAISKQETLKERETRKILELDAENERLKDKVDELTRKGEDLCNQNGGLLIERYDLMKLFQKIQLWYGLPGEGANEIFERIAADFKRETGYLRPGKDCRMYSREERGKVWEEWTEKKNDELDAEIVKVIASLADSVTP